ncbi:Nicotinic acetylcholine receptor beta 3 (Dbeta3) subunit [Strongyloides ratti]|uniref:Nicotinic acetylcholine receptor beta 3 (Dbeta3) subunit n=1 Tax=Strongyloides ratti TaxID=34506 RepID=A0A090MWR6_STRRB|nr:Nicotinic acetylcholine receptor beta 3 (Dbeta3) subunit [Strongyloides ratti]CEF64149.1 Nicotinic acetylcholine receptor beta 3 (Dbeta3) subunit [Strongyloides ratti]
MKKNFLIYFISLYILSLVFFIVGESPQHNKLITKKILKNYNKKHRPVKAESSPVNIFVQLRISHVESINQKEQAMYLHGQLFTSWKDEYLTWNPEEFNHTTAIYLDPFQIWQPALTLINNADAKGWNIHLGSTPALVSSSGYVILSGIFSFYVTCKFDFSYYPYDTQECPIALTEWIYDVSKVNLSEYTNDQAKPILKLSWDPIRNKSREHAGEWRIEDTWKRHCYWGPEGCVDTITNLQLEWYWSVVEFGIKITREASYFTMTITIPTITAVLITLTSFWITSYKIALILDIFSITMQGLFGWNLIHSLPPGNGSVPRIVYLYGGNLLLTLIAYIIHVLLGHLEYIYPEGIYFPSHITNITKVLRKKKFFQVEGITFDPSVMINEKIENNENLVDLEDPMIIENHPNIIEDLNNENNKGIICLENLSPDSDIELHENVKYNEENGINLSLNNTINDEDEEKKCKVTEVNLTRNQLNDQLFLIRRLMFIIFVVLYLIILFICCQ